MVRGRQRLEPSALLPGFGGPPGSYARPEGKWFQPLPWALLGATALFVFLVLRQLPCTHFEDGRSVSVYIRMCYSDIPVLYKMQGLPLGNSALLNDPMPAAPLLAGLLAWITFLAHWMGAPMALGATAEEQFAGSQLFYGISAVVLFGCFLVWVAATWFLGRRPVAARKGSWDAFSLAVSPLIFATGLIDWTLFPIALTAVAAVYLRREQHVKAAVWLGIAAAADLVPFVILLAVVAARVLAKRFKEAACYAGMGLGTWVVVQLPLLAVNLDGLMHYYRDRLEGDAGYGSLWWAARMFGWEARAIGSFGVALWALLMLVLVAWLFLRRAQPSVEVLSAVFVFAWLLLGAAFPPQHALWLLFVLLLTWRSRLELNWFTALEIIYWASVWGVLSGHLTATRSGPERLPYVLLLARVAVECWLLARLLRSIPSSPARLADKTAP